MQVTDKLKEQLGNWWEVLQPLIEQENGAFDKLFAFLKRQTKELNKTVMPVSSEVFKSLQLCDRHKVKAVILLQCPYATERDMNGKKVQIANGIPMDCSNTAPYMQPSLFHWYSALSDQYGWDADRDERCSLEYLLTEEHVLLLNSSLTTEAQKPDSHAREWEPVIAWFMENVINKYMCGLPIVLVGGTAARFEKYINPLCHHILKVEHMAAAAHSNREWKHQQLHRWVNSIIEANNGKEHCIHWTRQKGQKDDKDNKVLQSWLKGDKEPVTSSDLPFDRGIKQEGIKKKI